MTGFNHIEGAGVIEFWQLLNMKGSIDLLWDMPAKVKINALMQSENFNMDAHIKTNYCDYDSKVYNYDEVHAELHDEMIETITALEFCFATNTFSLQFNGRNLSNLNKIPEPTTWCPEIYYPISQPVEFTDIYKGFAQYCMEQTAKGHVIQATVVTGEPVDEEGNGNIAQEFTWKITGAADFNALQDMINDLTEHFGYHNLKVIATLK
jgi:hypothetical protein